MPEQRVKLTAAELLGRLDDQGLIAANQSTLEIEDFILQQVKDPDLPFYLKVLAGFGAFIASICFTVFLAAAEIISFNNETETLVWGIIFIAAAVGLYRVTDDDSSIKHSFFLQTSFALIAAGKLLFILAVAEWFDDDGWSISLAAFIITAITYPLYRLSIERFLSCTGVLITVLLNILWQNTYLYYDPELTGLGGGDPGWFNFDLTTGLLYNGFFLFQLIAGAILLTNTRIKPAFNPLAQSFLVSLSASVMVLTSHPEFGYLDEDKIISPFFANLMLAATLMALIIWAAGGRDKLRNEALILAMLGAVLLGFLSAPGILLSIGLLIFGYARHDRVFTLLGALQLPIFLSFYYYDLELSLMNKSGILVASGLVLLAGKFYLKLKGWDRGPDEEEDDTSEEETTCA